MAAGGGGGLYPCPTPGDRGDHGPTWSQGPRPLIGYQCPLPLKAMQLKALFGPGGSIAHDNVSVKIRHLGHWNLRPH